MCDKWSTMFEMSAAGIIQLVELSAKATGRSPHTVGRLVSDSGDFYSRLLNGHDLTTRRADRVVRRLSERWPERLAWPHDVVRRPPLTEVQGEPFAAHRGRVGRRDGP